MSNSLLMPFIDQSENYTLGFEAGQIWQRVENGESFTGQLIHTNNTEQIRLIMDFFSCKYEIRKADDEWSYLDVYSSTI